MFSETRWDIKRLLFWHALVALLIGSFLWPLTAVYWEKIDVLFFQVLNNSLKGNPLWQIFWACLNHPMMDWIADGIMLLFFTAYVCRSGATSRQRKVAESIFTALFIAAVIFFIITLLFRQYLRIRRMSPSLVVESSIRISKHIDWLSIKDSCNRSFPGDHATTVLLFGACFYHFAKGKLGLLAIAFAILLTLPRLILGAHWLTDVMMGSLPVTILSFTWVFHTPVKEWTITRLTALISRFSRQKVS